MEIEIDRSGTIPIYRQIAARIRGEIRAGQIPLSTSLPTVRAMSKSLGVAHMTVVRAYEELHQGGWTVTENRHSTRVVSELPPAHAISSLDRLPESGPLSEFEAVSKSARIRSLASSVPDPRLFDSDELIAEIGDLRRESDWLFYHAETAGNPELLTAIQGLLHADGLPYKASDLLVTFGGTHALSLSLDTLSGSRAKILVQEPGPLFLRQLLASKKIVGIPVRSAQSGIDLDHLAACMQLHRPAALLVSPDFGHSTGVRIPLDQRDSIVDLSGKHGVHIIEDGSFAALRYCEDRLPSIAEISGGQSSYIGSFSYSLSPGLRLGYLAAPASVRRRALAAFKAVHISGVGFLQTAVARYIERGSYAAHIKRALPKYRSRRDALMQSLTQWMPANVGWTVPEGGFSSWLTIEHPRSGADLYRRSLKRGVAFAPGNLFLTDGDPKRHARLSFGLLEPDQVSEAVRILSGVIGLSTN